MLKTSNHIVWIMLLGSGLGFIGGCERMSTAPASQAKRIVVIDDIAYRPGPSKAWHLDLAMPENFGEALRPAIVIIHGGGWRAGAKQDRPFR